MPQEEIFFLTNTSTKNVWVRVYPVSMVFNVDRNEVGNYDFHSRQSNDNFDYINGRGIGTSTIQYGKHLLIPNATKTWNMEGVTDPGESVAGIGRGVYKFEFFYETINNLVDSAIVEWDAGNFGDLTLVFDDSPEPPAVKTYYFAGMSGYATIPTDRKLNCWSYQNRNKNFGTWVFDDIEFENLTLLPQDFRMDCDVENHSSEDLYGEWRIGVLTLNMLIKKDNITTRLYEMYGAPHRIILTPGVAMTLDNNVDYTIAYNEYFETNNTYYNIMSVKPTAHLSLNSNSTLTVEKTNWLILERNSNLYIGSNALLSCQRGSIFCNRGANIVLNGRIAIKGKACADPTPDSPVYISGNGIFEVDSTEFYIPDSTSYTFDSNAVFLCKPYTKIILGKCSKLIFQNGSRINADNCTFVSYDSTQTWDGIYLDGIAYDTLKNCTFQNAVNGVNITDNYNPFGSPGAVEINNCTFKNSTSSDLLNYVYVNNSYNVLVKGCNAVKTGSGGFTSGIIAEYCPTNGVVIADNNINYVTKGISLLQSSEYIGRNTITGNTNSGTGIYLDNSNGTIEYNTVNNFQKSVYGSYSSPYMLKNTFSNAYVKNMDLASNSYPVMKPVVSGSTLRWLGGNNTITGTPTNSGIAFADCYPLMDSGYNRITVNGSDYMNGNFTFAYTTVYSRINYWYDNPPNSSLFDISGGSVNYSNPFNGSSLPSTDGTELNSLGWGMYDTVFTKSLGDNSTPEDLFMQAYTEEMSENYTDAVTHYKEVVSSYKTSSLAPVSLSRIFNCLEKSHATSPDFQTIQSYYSSIKTNSAYPNESRELSEDFVKKSKVKQGNIEDAVSDYNAIYQANQNNSKGLHALLNKYCLENMIQGDNSSSGNTNYENHKINILSLITGENIKSNNFSNNNTPKQFRLLQNYPNPFNPVTNIKYEIPKDVNVTIKIYNILGKEVFSYNEYKKAGSYEVQFDGTNLASGMYFYKLVVGDATLNTNNGVLFTDTKKMVLLK